MIEERISSGDLGWTIRRIDGVSASGAVRLNDGVSFASPCFEGARTGDIWAVKYKPSFGGFGKIEQAILLAPGPL
jgi:hypothetical protein